MTLEHLSQGAYRIPGQGQRAQRRACGRSQGGGGLRQMVSDGGSAKGRFLEFFLPGAAGRDIAILHMRQLDN